MQLTESSLLHSLTSARRYNAKDIADLCFLYMIALHILRCEFDFASKAKSYAQKTLSSGNFSYIHINNTDLYQFLNILLLQNAIWTQELKNQSSSHTFLNDIRLIQNDVIKFLRNIRQGGFDIDTSARLLLKIEQQLRISTTNYKSVRRIASDWTQPNVDHHAKSLALTRLLQAMRNRAFNGDLLDQLEKLARIHNLEYKTACNPEFSKNCDKSSSTHAQSNQTPSLLKQLAIGAGIGVGAYLLGKAMFSGSTEQKLPVLKEEIKGWKNAARDIARIRTDASNNAKPVKLVRLKKDGTESKMHDAVYYFNNENQATEYHNYLKQVNPKRKIQHNLYVDNHLKGMLDESLTEITCNNNSEDNESLTYTSINTIKEQQNYMEQWQNLDNQITELLARPDSITGKYAKQLLTISKQKSLIEKAGNLNVWGQPIIETTTSGATGSANIASSVNPFGIVIRRPSLFGYSPVKKRTKSQKNK